MYRSHFGLTQKPFSIAPDPSFLFMSERHREALAHLLYGVNSDSGFVLLTGDVGTGKTTICRCLLEQLPESSEVAYVINPSLSVSELLASVCDEFGIDYSNDQTSVKKFVDQINQYLLSVHARGDKPVLIIDEAQNLTEEVLEQIRLLTNLETNDRKLLLIILIGQPELRDKLAKHDLRQLSQRVTARYHLEALSKKETISYVHHRLAVAGVRQKLFDEKSLGKIFNLSKGIPRVINLLCDRALLGAYTQGRRSVNAKTVRIGASEVFCEPKIKRNHFSIVLPWVLTCLMIVTGIVGYFFGNSFQQSMIINASQLDKNNDLNVIIPNTESAIKHRSKNECMGLAGLFSVSEYGGYNPEQTDEPDYEVLRTLFQAAPDNQSTVMLESQGEVLAKVDSSEVSAQNVINKEIPDNTIISMPVVNETLQWPEKLDVDRSKVMAFQTLFREWGSTYQPAKYSAACDQAKTLGLRCLYNQGNLGSLRKMNRPAVLQMTNSQGQEYYVTLTELEQETAKLIVGTKTQLVAIADLEEQWSGSYTLLWQAPPQYESAVSPGKNAAWLPWLDKKLAGLEGKEKSSSGRKTLEGEFLENVLAFQQQSGLMPDGIIGPQTVICLNSVSATDDFPVLYER